MNRHSHTFIRILMVAACLSTGSLHAATLDANYAYNSTTTPPPIPLELGTQNVTRDSVSTFFEFGDRLGDGSDVAVTPAGLALGTFNLTSNSSARHLYLNLNGGDLSSTSGLISTSVSDNTASIRIFNVGTIAMEDGYLSTSHSRTTGANTSGNIEIGEAGARAGHIQVASLGTSPISQGGTTGGIFIHGSGNVLIENSANVAGNLSIGWGTGSGGITNSNIEVRHQGNFKANIVSSRRLHTNTLTTNTVIFDGAVVSGSPNGAFVTSEIDTRSFLANGSTNNRATNAGNISVENYTSVTIGQVLSHTESLDEAGTTTPAWRNTGKAGDISITGITGDISIAETVNASSNASGNPNASRGILTLQAGGKITLGSLDLNDVQAATLDATGGTYILGELLGFDTGNPGDGFLKGSNSSMVIYYDANVVGNSYLNGQTYNLANSSQLKPGVVPEPSTWALLALGALAGIAVRRRRR